MKAVIAAGGMGTRLSSVTKDIPKALVKIGDKPILEHQIILLKKHGVQEIHLLLGYLAGQIKDYFGDGKKWGVNLHYHQEEIPLGTAGALLQVKDNLQEDFLFLSGDIMMNFDVEKFIDWHQEKKDSVASLVVHPSDHPFDSDLVQISDDGKITKFFLKPHLQNSNPEGLGISSVSILSPAVFAHIPKGVKSGLEKDVLPSMFAHSLAVYAYNTPEYIKDMGTPERWAKVNDDYASGKIYNT